MGSFVMSDWLVELGFCYDVHRLQTVTLWQVELGFYYDVHRLQTVTLWQELRSSMFCSSLVKIASHVTSDFS